MATNFKIFISHSWTYHQDLVNLRNLLEARGYFNVEFLEATSDVPINSTNATYIKQALKTKILNSHIVLAIAGVYATHSSWMNYELQTAYEYKIPIIGVAPHGQERVSAIVQSFARQTVRWNTESIVQAIRRYSI
ncbi:TIR domain-containing protein [Mucilaginibacter sp.]|uniref:TIR domain-containing protein n=1 Tax=Mucilaginibacter sp. TaxID=1882438 RepID=UPI0025F3BAD3|nr:TIR domain-containing protein [Mucilaginibacter sp.]